MTDDERPKVSTVAELFAYVSAAWDTGGKSYCATRTWFGTGLQDAFERLATQDIWNQRRHNLKPSGLRRSTPASLFQQRQGHSGGATVG